MGKYLAANKDHTSDGLVINVGDVIVVRDQFSGNKSTDTKFDLAVFKQADWPAALTLPGVTDLTTLINVAKPGLLTKANRAEMQSMFGQQWMRIAQPGVPCCVFDGDPLVGTRYKGEVPYFVGGVMSLADPGRRLRLAHRGRRQDVPGLQADGDGGR